MDHTDRDSLANRPGVLLLGSSGVGKRTLLSRLLSVDFEDEADLSSDILAYGWTINTKYYTADISMWMAHLFNEFSITGVPMFDKVAALVMVFDLNNLSSFSELKKWVSCNNIENFDILLCIGNKADLLPGHSAHVEYRRRLLNLDESADYGISETEGNYLLGDEESSSEIKRSCMEWCLEHNIECIEACASNPRFDKCLSVDGDSQGVERLLGALSAHMWPGMVLKSGDTINQPSLPQQEDTSDEEEPNYEFEYEILSAGSVEPWDDKDVSWVSATNGHTEPDTKNKSVAGEDMQPSTSRQSQSQEEIDIETEIERATPEAHEEHGEANNDGGMHFELEDMEQLMSEIGSMRDSLRLMPDFQRREMAANLAMKMAAMFGDTSGDDEEEIKQ
ncbi:hypothetical protein L1987_36976 [Smallanthus sonchifolius]|uniref:Uncharacterized protein n=1 Tax=Smallanthus sonchifolius TaxID=185202 RepID=A0ACB9HFR3_9ASTR|nr:hypothetical protein L1987_36976 [Smallanthus sonchifolius]